MSDRNIFLMLYKLAFWKATNVDVDGLLDTSIREFKKPSCMCTPISGAAVLGARGGDHPNISFNPL